MNETLQAQIAHLFGLPLPEDRPMPALRGRWHADGTPYTAEDYELADCIRNVRRANTSNKLRYCK